MSVARSRPRWVLAAALVACVLVACGRSPTEPRNVVPGEYIVVFKDDVQDVEGLARGISNKVGGTVLSVWELALKGFAIRLREPARIAVARIRAHPAVKSVGPNHIGYLASDGP
jgi:hypothetical protein